MSRTLWLAIGFYAYVTCRAIWGNRRLSLWLVVPLSMIWPLLALPSMLRRVRHFEFKGMVDRQRQSLGLTQLNPEPLPVRWPSDVLDQCHPDDGGFEDDA